MIVSKKRNKTEDNFLFYAKFNISTYEKAYKQVFKINRTCDYCKRCYAINFEHPISNFIKKSEVRSHEKGRLHEKYIPYSRLFMLFLSYYLFSFKVCTAPSVVVTHTT